MGAMEVAVKQLQPGVTEAEKIRFLQEAAINGQFRHPNVVQLMGVVTTGEPVSLYFLCQPVAIAECYFTNTHAAAV